MTFTRQKFLSLAVAAAVLAGCVSRPSQSSLPAVNSKKKTDKAGLGEQKVAVVAPQLWPPSNVMPLQGAGRVFVEKQILAARQNPASTEIKKKLVKVSEKSHQVNLMKLEKTSPGNIVSSEPDEFNLINPDNAIVTFKVKSELADRYTRGSDYVWRYAYALYKVEGIWKVIAEYRITRFHATT